jgi:large subunit ribosomal protein L30
VSDLKISQRISVIGRPEAQRKILKGLGLRGIGSSVVVKNTPSFRGAIKKVLHLINVENAQDVKAAKS